MIFNINALKKRLRDTTGRNSFISAESLKENSQANDPSIEFKHASDTSLKEVLTGSRKIKAALACYKDAHNYTSKQATAFITPDQQNRFVQDALSNRQQPVAPAGDQFHDPDVEQQLSNIFERANPARFGLDPNQFPPREEWIQKQQDKENKRIEQENKRMQAAQQPMQQVQEPQQKMASDFLTPVEAYKLLLKGKR